MNELRIIIAGSRDFNDYSKLKSSCENIISQININYDKIRIVSGGARGADRLGEQFAQLHNYELTQFLAQWDKLGKGAGYARNVEMANFASEQGNYGILIAFWNGESRGTKHMIETAKKYKIDTYIINI